MDERTVEERIADLRKELIQVAAVAVAIVEDIDRGEANLQRTGGQHHIIIHDITKERQRQDEKWGPRHQEFPVWMTILGEEYGEACQEAIELWSLSNG